MLHSRREKMSLDETLVQQVQDNIWNVLLITNTLHNGLLSSDDGLKSRKQGMSEPYVHDPVYRCDTRKPSSGAP